MIGGGDDLIVIVNGVPFIGWEEARVEQSFDKATGQGTLKISEQPGQPFPINLGGKVQIICASTPVLTGHVHEVNGTLDEKHHSIQVTMHDKTKDFVDSTIGPGIAFKPPIQLKQVLRKTLDKMGLTGIQVIDKINPEPYGHAEVPVGAVDQTGHHFGDMWARKRNVVMNTDGKGNLNIDRNTKRMGSGWLFSTHEDSSLNNVKKSQYKNSDQNRHNTTAAAAQKSHNDMKHWEGRPKGDPPAQADKLQKNWGKANDTGVRPERRRHYRAGKGLEGSSPKKAAKWRSNLAKARGFQYTATVQGFEMSPGQLWWPGFVIPVLDAHWNLSDTLLIVDVRFHKDWQKGATTEVVCTFSDAYSESEGSSSSRTAKRGIGGGDAGAYEPASMPDIEGDQGGNG